MCVCVFLLDNVELCTDGSTSETISQIKSRVTREAMCTVPTRKRQYVAFAFHAHQTRFDVGEWRLFETHVVMQHRLLAAILNHNLRVVTAITDAAATDIANRCTVVDT